MADSFQDKTEQPTGKRLSDARQEGNVPKSQDVSSTAILLAGTVGLLVFGPGMTEQIEQAFRGIYNHLWTIELTPDIMKDLWQSAFFYLLKLLGPLLLLLTLVGVASHIAQTGPMIAGKAVELNLSRLSPLQNMKRIFSSRGVVELSKGFVKILIVGWIAYVTVRSEIPFLVKLMDEEVGQIITAIGHSLYKLALRITIAYAILAVLDFAFQKWKFLQDMKMTKQEVKEEYRQMEGDPQIKGKIRQIQMKTSMNQMIKKMPEADVVLANPVHLAVALKYDPATMQAPQVIAKGKRKLAERIKAIARQHNIPVIEEPELARALYKAADVGGDIPYELYQAVAEVLAMVYRLKKAA
jgi:flagellar biosynthetic protein FlhB